MQSTRLCWASTGSGKCSACSALAFENENFPVAMVPKLRSQINANNHLENNQRTNAAFVNLWATGVRHGCGTMQRPVCFDYEWYGRETTTKLLHVERQS